MMYPTDDACQVMVVGPRSLIYAFVSTDDKIHSNLKDTSRFNPL